jgi:hypothetical protein
MLYAAALVYGNTQYDPNDNVQDDCEHHFPVYKTKVAGVVCAIKVIAFETVDEALACGWNMVHLHTHCSGLIAPIKEIATVEFMFRGTWVHIVKTTTAWAPLEPGVPPSWVVDTCYRITLKSIEHGRFFNDLCYRNMGMLGAFDIDEEWGTHALQEGTYASHSAVVLAWEQLYGANRMLEAGDFTALSLDAKGAILGCIPTSALTQLLIFAEICRSTAQSAESANSYTNALSVASNLHAILTKSRNTEAIKETVHIVYGVYLDSVDKTPFMDGLQSVASAIK